MDKKYKLLDENGKEYLSDTKGQFGGYNGKEKIYGKLDCKSANNWIKKGYYVNKRVFFASESDAVKAGFRPCGCCMKEKYNLWKQDPVKFKESILNDNDNKTQNPTNKNEEELSL